MKLKFVAIAVAGLAVLPASAIPIEGSRSVWSGVYSLDQAKLGQASYEKKCASCHGDQLDGVGESPALSGVDFSSDWTGHTVGDLFDRVLKTMPADNPGTLSPEEDADILAYILQSNKFPAGNAELPAQSEPLKQISLDFKKPDK